VPALSAAVDGYSHAPEMAVLSNILHLMLAGLSVSPQFLHVPGKANPADISSRVPFVRKTVCVCWVLCFGPSAPESCV
jgi:hypothetical protein